MKLPKQLKKRILEGYGKIKLLDGFYQLSDSVSDSLSSKLGLFTDFNSYVLIDNNTSYILKFNWTIQKWTVKMVDMNEDISFYEVIGE